MDLEKLQELADKDLKIKGSAIAQSESRKIERFFIIANYGSSKTQKIIKYQNNKMSKEYKTSFINKLAFPFEGIIPLEFEEVPLSNISIETRNSSKIILEQELINKLFKK